MLVRAQETRRSDDALGHCTLKRQHLLSGPKTEGDSVGTSPLDLKVGTAATSVFKAYSVMGVTQR